MAERMTQNWQTASLLFDGYQLHNDQAIRIEDGRVSAHLPIAEMPADIRASHHHGLLTPGFFDIQVNGGGGVLLNTEPTIKGIEAILKAHRKLGTRALLPTVITDHPDVTQKAAFACLEAKDLPGMMGIHIEGPHIALARRGTHKAAFIRDLDAPTFELVKTLRSHDLPVLMTLAPEACTPDQVAKLTGIGVIVSIGHSDAISKDAQAHLAAGATAFTHLFNAMSPMESRAPGVVGAAIASDAYCSIIADGIHVDPLMVRLAHQARPKPDRMIAVSDAMPTVGGPDQFDLYGNTIRLQEGRLINSEGSLAGAHLTMLEAIRNLTAFGLPLEEALRSGIHNPAQLMGLWPQMKLIGTGVEDLLKLSSELELISIGL